MSLILNQGSAGFEFGAIAYVLVSFVLFTCQRSGLTSPTPALTSIATDTTPVAAKPKPAAIAAGSTISHTAALSTSVTATVMKEKQNTPPRHAQALTQGVSY